MQIVSSWPIQVQESFDQTKHQEITQIINYISRNHKTVIEGKNHKTAHKHLAFMTEVYYCLEIKIIDQTFMII